MHCFTLRTKSPPVISSSSSTSARASPSTQSCDVEREPRVGAAGLGEPGVVLVVVQVPPDALDRARRAARRSCSASGAVASARAVGPAALVREARHDRRELAVREPVEQPVADRLRDHEIALGVEAGEQLAGVGERPAVDVAPRLEHAQHAVELAGQALAAAARLGARGGRRRVRVGRPRPRPSTWW